MLPTRLLAALLCLTLLGRAERRVKMADFEAPVPVPPGSMIVIGFLGGWEVWDSPKRPVRKFALTLRQRNLPRLYVETAGNHSRTTVLKFLRRALDQNGNGKIDPAERDSVAIVLYGHSFGGAAAIKLARELRRYKVPVRLTVQVDSVGRDDDVIPDNVARAMNLYQHDPGPIWGRSLIRAADPGKTQILGNQRFSYLFRTDIDMSDYPKLVRHAPVSHWRMENDPEVWAIVERLVLEEVERWRASAARSPSGRGRTSR